MIPFIIGLPTKTVDQMMLLKQRKKGMIIDASIVNPDKELHYEDYSVENIQIPMLIFHAKDDKMVKYRKVKPSFSRFKSSVEWNVFEKGGHMMTGHEQAINDKIEHFIEKNCHDNGTI